MSVGSRPLGRSGLTTSTLALGTMMFGAWGNPDEAQCRRMVDLAIDGGVTLFDTADMYDFGVSEEILGRALRGRRDGVLVATKVGNPMSDDPAERGLSPRWIRHQCEASLRRLGTDRIDLYQLHRPDPATPIDETLGALHELVTSGKIRAIGTSTFSAAQLDQAQSAATAGGFTAPTTEQPPFSVFARGIEREVLPACHRHGLGVLVWAPLNGGWLTGKYRPTATAAAPADAGSRAERQPDHFDHRDAAIRTRKVELVEQLAAVADGAGLTLTQLALGFVLADPAVSAALIGPRTPEQLTQLLSAGHQPLSADVLSAIDAMAPPGENVNPADAG